MPISCGYSAANSFQPCRIKIKGVILEHNNLQRIALLQPCKLSQQVFYTAATARPAFAAVKLLIGMVKTVAAFERTSRDVMAYTVACSLCGYARSYISRSGYRERVQIFDERPHIIFYDAAVRLLNPPVGNSIRQTAAVPLKSIDERRQGNLPSSPRQTASMPSSWMNSG